MPKRVQERNRMTTAAESNKKKKASIASIDHLPSNGHEKKLESEILVLKEENKKLTELKDTVKSEFVCSVCQDMVIKAHGLPCQHLFCEYCIKRWLKKTPHCPFCRVRATDKLLTHMACIDTVVDKYFDINSQETKDERKKNLDERQANLAELPNVNDKTSNELDFATDSEDDDEYDSGEDDTDVEGGDIIFNDLFNVHVPPMPHFNVDLGGVANNLFEGSESESDDDETEFGEVPAILGDSDMSVQEQLGPSSDDASNTDTDEDIEIRSMPLQTARRTGGPPGQARNGDIVFSGRISTGINWQASPEFQQAIFNSLFGRNSASGRTRREAVANERALQASGAVPASPLASNTPRTTVQIPSMRRRPLQTARRTGFSLRRIATQMGSRAGVRRAPRPSAQRPAARSANQFEASRQNQTITISSSSDSDSDTEDDVSVASPEARRIITDDSPDSSDAEKQAVVAPPTVRPRQTARRSTPFY